MVEVAEVVEGDTVGEAVATEEDEVLGVGAMDETGIEIMEIVMEVEGTEEEIGMKEGDVTEVIPGDFIPHVSNY